MKKVYFASSNNEKFLEIHKLAEMENMSDIDLEFKKITIKEIQSNSMLEVAEDKAKKAFNEIRKPVIVEDDGLFIKSLNGFPGVYSSFVYKSLGNEGILDLLADKRKSREAIFISIISYHDKSNLKSFEGQTKGKIKENITTGGWGFDPIFLPAAYKNTFGEMDILTKNKSSHRRKAFLKFYEWFV